MDGNLNQHEDPWDLPPYFLLRNNKSDSLRTHSGYWKEKEEELTAIRSAAGDSSSSSTTASPPSYVGVRKTLEFYLKDGTRAGQGTKTDWIIHEYYDLRKDDAGAALLLQEDVVLRKVFKKSKNKTHSDDILYRQVESCVKAYKPDVILSTEEKLARLKQLSLSLEQGRQECRILNHSFETFKLQGEPLQLSVYSLSARDEDLGVGCHPDGKSDNVWKHFTKIRSCNDPDEVYAACHRCDKVLKAHPKKHGTSHLKRHIHTCSSCTNPSTDEDREMLDHLRTALVDPSYEQEQQKMDLTQMAPWDLNLTHPTSWYVTRSLNRQTQGGGHWKEINKVFTAIRMDQKVCWKDIIDKEEIAVDHQQLQEEEQAPQPPHYMGLRRTLHFHHQDGSMMDWIMHEYQQLHDGMESHTLLLQGCMVIRKVFRYDKDAVASAFTDLDRLLNGEEEYCNGDGMNTDIATPSDCMDSPCSVFPLGEGVSSGTTTPSCDPVDRKRKRRTGAASGHKSQVWMHFTKIYSRDYGVVYVVCHTCDRGYGSGRSTNGTSHLWRHNKSCTNKHSRTGNANDATAAEWDAEIWPLFLLLKNYGEHQPSGAMC